MSTQKYRSGGFTDWAQQAEDINQQRWLPGAATARHSAANASTVTLSANTESCNTDSRLEILPNLE